MKKTISVNIKGINFVVEEDAYELLQNYLERLASTLGNQPGSKEIIEDVEIRIAELCNLSLSETKTVIELADIEKILSNLGNPEDFLTDAEDDEETVNDKEYYRQAQEAINEKRLFRDEDNATIAGVCAGIANYFNIDVVIIRIIFVAMFLIGGFGFPLYIIMWIVIPKAKNTIDRLRMKGRPITVETVKQEVEHAAEKVKEGSKRFAKRIKRDDYGRRVSRGARIIASLIGFALIAFGLLHLITFLIFIIGGVQFFPVQSDTGFLSFAELGDLVLSNPNDYKWAWIGGLMVALSIILFFFLLGSILLFRLRNSWSKLSLLGLFLTGLAGFFVCLSIGMSTGRDFAIDGEIERTVGSVQTEELIIIPQLDQVENIESFDVKSNGKWGLMSIDEENIREHGIRFRYIPSPDSLFHIKQNFSARSHSHKTALEKSKNIHHSIALSGDSLWVDTEYTFPKTDKLRDQDVVIIIEIPKNGQIRFKDRIVRLGSEDFDEEIYDDDYDESGILKGNGTYRHWD